MHSGVNQRSEVIFFDIPGITCQKCIDAIQVEFAKKPLRIDASNSTIDLATKRASVVIYPSTRPAEVLELIRSLKDGKFASTEYIPADSEEAFYFSVKGLKTLEDAKKVREKLELLEATVKLSEILWGTKTVKVVARIEKKSQIQATLTQLKTQISEAIPDRKLEVYEMEVSNQEDPFKKRAKEYRKNFVINLTFGIAYYLLAGFIPVPLTFWGQLIGFALGAVTLGMMWKTGKEFYQEAWGELKLRQSERFGMSSLIALGTSAAWTYSMIITAFPTLFAALALQYQYLAAIMILGIINCGRAIRAQFEEETRQNIKKLSNVYAAMQPHWVKKLKRKDLDFNKEIPEDEIEEVHYTHIKTGDILCIDKEEYIPVEGKILNDVTTIVNQEALTGEAKPCAKTKNTPLYSGSLNKGGRILIEASCDGKEAALTKLIAENESKSNKKPAVLSKNMDNFANYFVPVVIVLATVTGLGWLIFGPAPALPIAIKTFMAMLLSACPCALLLTPMSTTIAIRQLFKLGIRVPDASIINTLATVNTVIFDKTGVLTQPVYKEMFMLEEDKNFNQKDVLQFATRLQREVEHPIATAFKNIPNLDSEAIGRIKCSEFVRKELGVSAYVQANHANLSSSDPKNQKRHIILGSSDFFSSESIEIDATLRLKEKEYAEKGMTAVYLSIDKKCIGIVALEHRIDEAARSEVLLLKNKLGIEVYMATGDKKSVSEKIAKELGIPLEKVHSELTPEAKKALVQKLQAQGGIVAMVGDNVNDNLALNIANVSVARGPWTNVAASSHVVIKHLNMATAITVCKKTMDNINTNIKCVLGYNVLSLGAASGIFYSLSPVAASAFMMLSSLFVLISAGRLSGNINKSIKELVSNHQPQKGLFSFLSSIVLGVRDIFYAILHGLVEKPKEAPPSPLRKKPTTPEVKWDSKLQTWVDGQGRTVDRQKLTEILDGNAHSPAISDMTKNEEPVKHDQTVNPLISSILYPSQSSELVRNPEAEKEDFTKKGLRRIARNLTQDPAFQTAPADPWPPQGSNAPTNDATSVRLK